MKWFWDLVDNWTIDAGDEAARFKKWILWMRRWDECGNDHHCLRRVTKVTVLLCTHLTVCCTFTKMHSRVCSDIWCLMVSFLNHDSQELSFGAGTHARPNVWSRMSYPQVLWQRVKTTLYIKHSVKIRLWICHENPFQATATKITRSWLFSPNSLLWWVTFGWLALTVAIWCLFLCVLCLFCHPAAGVYTLTWSLDVHCCINVWCCRQQHSGPLWLDNSAYTRQHFLLT